MNKHKGGKMDFKSLFKNFDYKYIIAEVKKLRKGAVMILFIVCLCCAVLDFFLRRLGIVYNWLPQVYLLGGIISITALSIKSYNSYCDKKEAQREAQQAEKEYNELIQKKAHLLKQVIDSMSERQKEYLKKFVDEETEIIFIKRDYGLNDPVLIANYINAQIFTFGYYLIIGGNVTHVSLTINSELLDILTICFKN